MECPHLPVNIELSKAGPLTPTIGAKKKPILIENPAGALTYKCNHNPRDIVVSCMSALIGIQPVGAFSETVSWTGGPATPDGHRKAAFLALGGFCALVKPLTSLNCRYITDIWTVYSKKFGIEFFSNSDVRELIDTVMKFQDYVNKSPTFTRTWLATYQQRHHVSGRKGCPDVEMHIDEVFKSCKVLEHTHSCCVNPVH